MELHLGCGEVRTMRQAWIVFCMIASMCVATPVASNTGARHLQYASSSEDEKFYILDGAMGLWDGIWNVGWGVHDGSSVTWMNLLGDSPIGGVAFGDDYAVPTGTSPSFTDGRLSMFRISGNFTLHAVIRNPPFAWYNWTSLGIGTGAGLENGICLSARDGGAGGFVCYRKSYSGSVLNKVGTGTISGELFSVDIVFFYDTKTYAVYVNGIYAGETTISMEDWNLDGKNLSIGMQFQRNDLYGNYENHLIIYYNRALSEDEIAYNYSIDEARFGL